MNVPNSIRCAGVALVTAASCLLASAQPVAGEAARAAERARLQAVQNAIEAQYAAEQARCNERFAVTACVDDVRRRRREALAAPRAQALAIDDADRRERAAQRRQAVEDKRRLAAERPVAVPRAEPPAPVPRAAAVPPRAASATRDRAPERAALARHRAQASKERRAQADDDRARLQARQAEHARKNKSAAPLPVPAAASAAAR